MVVSERRAKVYPYVPSVRTVSIASLPKVGTLEEMIELGHYDWVSPRYGGFAKGRWRLSVRAALFAAINPFLLEFHEEADDALLDAELHAHAVRLATLEQILAFGATWRDACADHPISTRIRPRGRRGTIRPSLRCLDGEYGLYETASMYEGYDPGEHLLVFRR